jgi:hypothetical protein
MLGPLPDFHFPAASQPLQALDDDIQMYIKPSDSADGGQSVYNARCWDGKQGQEERGEASSYHPSQRGRHGSSAQSRVPESSNSSGNVEAAIDVSVPLFGFSDALGSLTPFGKDGSAVLGTLVQPGGLTVEGMSNIWPAYEETTWYGPRGPPRRPAGEAVTEPIPTNLLHPFVSFLHAEQRTSRQVASRPRPTPSSSTTAAVPLPMPPPPQDSQATAMSQDYPTGPYLQASQRSGLGMGLASQEDSSSSQSGGVEGENDGDITAQAPPPAVAAMIRHAFGAEMMRLGKDQYGTEVREAPASHAYAYAACKQSILLPPHVLQAITNSEWVGLAGDVGHACMASLFDIRDTHSLNHLGFSTFVLTAINARRTAILAATDAATSIVSVTETGVPTTLPADPIGVDKVHTAISTTSTVAAAAERTAPPTVISGLSSPDPSTATGSAPQAGKLASPISPGDANLLIHVANTNTVINGRPSKSPPSSEKRSGLPIATPIKATVSSSAPLSSISDSTGSTPASGGKAGAATHERGATSPELLLSMQFGASQAAAVAPTPGAPEVSPGQASTPHLAMMLDEMRERERVDYPAGMSPDSASAAAALDAFTRRGFTNAHPKFTFSPQRNNRASPKRPKPTTPLRTLSDNLKMATTSRKLMLNEIDSAAELPLAGIPLPVFVTDVRSVADAHGRLKDSTTSLLLVGARASTSTSSVMNIMNDLCRDSEELQLARSHLSNDRVNSLAGTKRKADPTWGDGSDAKRSASMSADRFPQLSRPRRSNRSTGRTGYSHIIAKHAAAARIRTRGTLSLRTGPVGLTRIAPVSVLATSFQLLPRLSAMGATLTTAAAPLLAGDQAVTKPTMEYTALVAKAQERLRRLQPVRRVGKVRRGKGEDTDGEEEEDEDEEDEEDEDDEYEDGDDGRQLAIPLQKVFAHHVDGRVLDVCLSGSVRLHKALTSSLFGPEEILRPAPRPNRYSDQPHSSQGMLSPLPSAARVSAAEAMVDLVLQHADATAGVPSLVSTGKGSSMKAGEASGSRAGWTPSDGKSRGRPSASHSTAAGQDHAMPGDHDDAITAGLIASAKRTRTAAPFDPFQDSDDAPPSASGRVNHLDGILGSPFREFSGLPSSRDDDHLLSSPGRKVVAAIKYDMSPPPSLRRTVEQQQQQHAAGSASGDRHVLSPTKPIRHDSGLDRRETPVGSRSAFRSSPQRSPGLMELPAHTSVSSLEGSPASLWLSIRSGQPDSLQHSPATSSHLVSSLPVAIPLNANMFSNAHKAASASSHPTAPVRIPVNGLFPTGARLDSLPTPAAGSSTDPKHMTPGDFLSKDEPN